MGPDIAYVTRHDTVTEVLRDLNKFSSRGGLTLSAAEDDAADTENTINATDPPLHTKFRKLLRTAVAPRLVTANEGFIAQMSEEFVDDFIADGKADLVSAFAVKLPARVIREAILQLRGEATGRQVDDARTAVVAAGGGTPAGVMLLRRAD